MSDEWSPDTWIWMVPIMDSGELGQNRAQECEATPDTFITYEKKSDQLIRVFFLVLYYRHHYDTAKEEYRKRTS